MTTPNERCLFCRIAAGDVPANLVHEDEHVLAFHDINPQAPTHILVIPRRHIPSLDEMTPGDVEAVGQTIHRATEIARDQQISGEGYRLVINQGEAAGQSVFHIHVHLIGGRNLKWPPG
jgi:histidine triad (HIT) family protein